MEVLMSYCLELLNASKEAMPLMVVYLILQTEAIKGRLIRVETILEA